MFIGKRSVYETMTRARVNEGGDRRSCISDDRNGRRKLIWIGKSGRVESELLRCTLGVNAATIVCGVGAADYFFDSVVAAGAAGVGAAETLAALPLALEALDVDLGHSLAMWPAWPQNMQRFPLMRRWCSSSVNLPSFPR